MKSIVLLLPLAGSPCAFAQTDTNLVAIGDSSQPLSRLLKTGARKSS